MKFFEFGEGNDKTLLIECGYLAKWNPGLHGSAEKGAARKVHKLLKKVLSLCTRFLITPVMRN